MQVMSNADYTQAATQNHTRQVLVPAPRGTIVDSQGRTLVGNRVSLVITVDRSVLAKLPDSQQNVVITRLAKVLGQKPKDLKARTMLCGEPGASKPPACWNGTPYQPIPVAKDVSEQVAIEVMERREDFPGVAADSQALRAYPAPYKVNAAHILGYLSPITTEELDGLEKADRTRCRTAPTWSAGPASSARTTSSCAVRRASRTSSSTRSGTPPASRSRPRRCPEPPW